MFKHIAVSGRHVAAGVALAGALWACGGGAVAPNQWLAPPDPASAQFVTSDIENFWRAYDTRGTTGSVAAFQREYIERASPGLRDFIQARSVTAASLDQMVQRFAQYFDAIRPNTLRLAQNPAILDVIRANYQRTEALYPPAIYPPVTFLFGRFSTAGTVRQSGILIGTEFYAIDATTPLGELLDFQRANVRPLDSIPLIVAHEHAHVLQGNARKLSSKANKTLLDQALLEGSADFIAELVAGSHTNKVIYVYGFAHEAELWTEFQAAMTGFDISQWLYNQGSSISRPGDLGYFIGYRITQAYYDRAVDKTAALRDIIEVSDAAAFLAASGYPVIAMRSD